MDERKTCRGDVTLANDLETAFALFLDGALVGMGAVTGGYLAMKFWDWMFKPEANK